MTRWSRILCWFREQRALVRHLDDAHRALRSAVRDLRVLGEQHARLADDVRLYSQVATCTDPASHIRLAHRLEQAEAQLQEATGVDAHRHSVEGR